MIGPVSFGVITYFVLELPVPTQRRGRSGGGSVRDVRRRAAPPVVSRETERFSGSRRGMYSQERFRSVMDASGKAVHGAEETARE